MNQLQAFSGSGVRGWSYDKASLMGMPHVKRDKCVICGKPKHDNHHLVEKGMGGGSRTMHIGIHMLLSPEFSVCGFGNTCGCHRDFHCHLYKVKWVWSRPEYATVWWDGSILDRGYVSNDERLWGVGHYEIFRDGVLFKTISQDCC